MCVGFVYEEWSEQESGSHVELTSLVKRKQVIAACLGNDDPTESFRNVVAIFNSEL